MEESKQISENDKVYDFVFGIENRSGIRQVYNAVLEFPLLAEINEQDKDILLEKFTFIEENRNEYPGFIFMKIDTFTEMVYVHYVVKRVLMNFPSIR